MSRVELPAAPRPHEDELISSWLGRTAALYDLDGEQLRQWLQPHAGRMARPDIALDPVEAAQLAAACRVAPARLQALDLAHVWPGLMIDWLPQTAGQQKRALSHIDLAWCAMCLAEAHATGGAYLDRETALPLIFCHRHHTWRRDSCRHCQPRKPPRFLYGAQVELVCADCGAPLRLQQRITPRPPYNEVTPQSEFAQNTLFAFEREVRRAILGHYAVLPGVGVVRPRQLLAVITDLVWLLTTPVRNYGSMINAFVSRTLPFTPNQAPWKWEPLVYSECSPLWRAWLLSAVVTILAPEPVSHMMSWHVLRGRTHQNLEWLLDRASHGGLIYLAFNFARDADRWPRELRERVQAHPGWIRDNIEGEKAAFDAMCAEQNRPTQIG